jgi:hypothetical protein
MEFPHLKDQAVSQHNASEQDVKWVNFDAQKNTRQ